MFNPFDVFLPIFVPLVQLLHTGLVELAIYTGSGGLAIILFTLLLKLILLPLSVMQTRSMKAMQAIQPELAELRKKHGKDRQRMAAEQMALYKAHGVNPAAGCLPMLPVMFVLIALYTVLVELSCDPDVANQTCDTTKGDPRFYESWLWVHNLGQPDIPFTLPGGIPVPGILPILMLVTQFIYGKLTPMTGSPDDPQQQMMQRMTTYFMPVMLFVFSFNFPAGLVLYWTISNIAEIARMGFSLGWTPLAPGNLFADLGLGGGAAVATKAPPANRRPSAEAAVNPAPDRPARESRRKKGKRGGKR